MPHRVEHLSQFGFLEVFFCTNVLLLHSALLFADVQQARKAHPKPSDSNHVQPKNTYSFFLVLVLEPSHSMQELIQSRLAKSEENAIYEIFMEPGLRFGILLIELSPNRCNFLIF